MPRTCPEFHGRQDDQVLPCPEDAGAPPAREGAEDLIGRSIRSYRVTQLLGAGGMGAVYLAEHPRISSQVAIKFLHPQYAGDPKIVERFFNEARAVNLIGHDNILKILDLDVTDDGRHYFVMELLRGRPLQDLVDAGLPVPLRIAGPILLQICEALQAAHERGVVHRDLKPANVQLTVHRGRKNFVKVVDFGIARVADASGASTGRTEAGVVLGTPAYMSPEQAAGLSARIDGRSDVYSLGCLMFQMATGRLPFPEGNLGESIVAHLRQPPPRARELVPAIPEAYEALILKCMEKKPEDRFQSMREVHDALARVMAEAGIARELPVADGKDLAAASFPTLRLPQPGRPLPESRARAGKQRVGLWLSAGALAAAGGIALLQADESRKEAERARLQMERIAMQAREEAQRAQEEQQRAQAESVQLSVVSEPEGALVEASWSGGARAATAPFVLSVPRNASVHFAFSKRGFASWTTDVLADAPKSVRAALPARAQPEPPRRAASPRKKPAGQASAEMKDDTIPVEF